MNKAKTTARGGEEDKHLVLDGSKREKDRQASFASENERARGNVIGEEEKNRRVWAATERLIRSGMRVKDVFGRLDE